MSIPNPNDPGERARFTSDEEYDLALRRYRYFDLGDLRALSPAEVGATLVEASQTLRLVEETLELGGHLMSPEQRQRLTGQARYLRLLTVRGGVQ